MKQFSSIVNDYLTNNSEFKKLIEIINKNTNLEKKHFKILNEELEYLIKHISNFEESFLIAYKISEFLKMVQPQVSWGRGNMANSMLLFSLGVTLVDPIEFGLNYKKCYLDDKLKLYFDIEKDSPIYKYLKKEFKGRIALVGTSNYMTISQSLEKELSPKEFYYINPFFKEYINKHKLDKTSQDTFWEVYNNIPEVKNTMLFDQYTRNMVLTNIGDFNYYGIDPSGVLIGDLDSYTLIDRENPYNLPVIHPKHLNDDKIIRLVKTDILSIEEDFDFNKAMQNIRNNKMDGRYIKEWMKKAIDFNDIKNLEDLAFALVYCRPGWLEHGLDVRETPEDFKKYLTKSKGLLIYQEDFIRIVEDREPTWSLNMLKEFSRYEYQNEELYLTKFSKEEIAFLQRYSLIAFPKSHALVLAQYSILENLNKKDN